MASILEIREAIAAAINGAGLRQTAHALVPSTLNEPVAVVTFDGADNSRETYGRGFWRLALEVTIYEPLTGGDTGDAETRILNAIDWTGSSVVAALEIDPTFGLDSTTSQIDSLSTFGTAEVAGRRYITVTVNMTVITKGT